MAVLPANWPTTGGTYNGANQNNVENAVNGNPAKVAAKVVAATALPAGAYSNGTAGLGATYTVTATGATTVDGHVLAVGEVVLLAGQGLQLQNGPYTVSTAGTTGVSTILTRVPQMNSSADFPGGIVSVSSGDMYASTIWVCTAGTLPVIGTDALPFVQPRYVKRVAANALSPATLALSIATADVYKITALANPIAFTYTGPATDDAPLKVTIVDNGTSQLLSWSSSFTAMGVVGGLPGYTPAGRKMTLQFFWDADVSRLVLSAVDVVGY